MWDVFKSLKWNWITLTSGLYLSVLIETLQDLPPPVSVLGVLSESVQVEQAFYRLWSQQVVSVCGLETQQSVINIKLHIPTGRSEHQIKSEAPRFKYYCAIRNDQQYVQKKEEIWQNWTSYQALFQITLTYISRLSLACRLKCAISGLRPVSICLYIW